MTKNNAKIMAVVKADGYGHGAIEIAKSLLENGADSLAVAMLEEAIQLRNAGINSQILILGHTIPQKAEEIIKYSCTQTIYNKDLAEAISQAALHMNQKAKVHIKIDSGMSRVGFCDDDIQQILDISKLSGLEIEGIYTHFSCADEKDKSYTNKQFGSFLETVEKIRKQGLEIPIKHAANSAAIIFHPQTHLDMVRPGISLYGFYPSNEIDRSIINLKQAVSLKTHVIYVKNVKKGVPVSYGNIFTTTSDARLVTIPVGYADGYTRLLTNKGKALLNGQIAPIVGKICMDQCVLDATKIVGDIKVGDIAVLYGEQGNGEIHVDQVAQSIGTINYEIVCMLGKRLPRIYT
jgi:alanine racemase